MGIELQSTKITIQLHYTTMRLSINKNLFKKKSGFERSHLTTKMHKAFRGGNISLIKSISPNIKLRIVPSP